jgi:glycosyltransferase involved in cell wall biosynthesis
MRILIAAGFTKSLMNFRYDLMKEMCGLGHEITATGPEPLEGIGLSDIGVDFIMTPMDRQSANPASDMKLIGRYRDLMARVRPDVVLCYTIKPNVYAAPEARKAGARVYTMVTGLGNTFIARDGAGIKRRITRAAVKRLYRKSARASERVIFQNPDDLRDFVDFGIIAAADVDAKTAIVNGSGVNMDWFMPSPIPEKPVFLMAARLLREKGVIEYISAARALKTRYPEAECLLAGPFENAEWALKESDIKPYIGDGSISYLGEVSDMREAYARSAIYVLPSYREGTPRTALEAMACGRAVITSDAPGCRETVVPGKTGLLVPPGDIEALEAAMSALAGDMELARSMGREGYVYCKEKYEVGKVNQSMLSIMDLL